MDIRVFDGQRATNRVGAAEYLNRSPQTIALLASAKQRGRTGWPEPVAIENRHHWYALDDLDAFRASYLEPVEQANRARVHHIDVADLDPDELLSATQFRELIAVSEGAWYRYVGMSKNAWATGNDGYLPRPDLEEPATNGYRRYWRAATAAAWVNQRPGKTKS